jgi:hypothetical protein
LTVKPGLLLIGMRFYGILVPELAFVNSVWSLRS